MRDVPLAKAVIVANSILGGKSPVVAVFPYRDPRGREYDIDFGACSSLWRECPELRLGLLFQGMWYLAHVHEIPTVMIDRAVQVIPEYRDIRANML